MVCPICLNVRISHTKCHWRKNGTNYNTWQEIILIFALWMRVRWLKKRNLRYDCGAPDSIVIGPPVCAFLQGSIQTFWSICQIPRAGGPILAQQVPLWSSVTPAPLRPPFPVQRYCDQQRFLQAQVGLGEVCVRTAVVRRHRGHKVLQQVVAGHHQDRDTQEGHMHDLEAPCAAHLL